MTHVIYQVRLVVEQVEIDDDLHVVNYGGEVHGEDVIFCAHREEAESKCRIYKGMADEYEKSMTELCGEDGSAHGDKLSTPSELLVAILTATGLLLMGFRSFLV